MAQSDFIVKNGAVVLNGQTATSTSTTTGALVIHGGIATSDQSTFGGKLNVINTTSAIDPYTGAVTIAGGLGVAGNFHIGGSVFKDGADLFAYDDHVYYVSDGAGSDTNDGRRVSTAFRTIKHALSVATFGDTVYIESGTYTEEFPLTIPQGVSVKGAGLREVFVQPTTATNTSSAFLLNGEVTISDFTVGNFYKPGYAFEYATSATITTRSPYVERFTVLTKGSNPTATDPYGFDSNDAGGGAFFDGSRVSKNSIEAAVLFNEATFIVPSAEALSVTNGVRVEFLNGFSYFADKAIKYTSGSTGWGGAGQTRLKLSGTTGTVAVGDFLYYVDSTGTVAASAEIADVDGDYVYFDGKVTGFVESTDRSGKVVNVYGDTALSSFQRKIGTASVHFTADGDLLDIVNDADFQFGTGAYTFETWFYLDTTSRKQYLFNKGLTTSTQISLYIDTSNRLVGQHGTSVITGSSTISGSGWYHAALVRDTANNVTIFLNGSSQATTSTSANINNGDSLTIGGYTGLDAVSLRGYMDEVRVSKVGRYSTTFTPSTVSFNSDVNTALLLHCDGADTSIDIRDDGQGAQNVYTTQGLYNDPVVASATAITLADYRQFGGELRCIGSAACYGNYGIYADGVGIDIKAIAFNMSFVGSGKDLSNDPTLSVQANEIVSLNGAKVYFQTVDHLGDFRVGPEFRINQRTGNVDFGTANFRLGPLSSLTVSDGVDAVVVQPSSISVGSLLLSANRLQTISGNLIIDPSGSLTTIESNLQVNGGLNFTGQFLATSVANSTSTTTGAIVVSGGIGLAKDIYVGGNATVAGNLVVKGTTTVVNSTQTSISDPVLDLGTGENGADVLVNDHYDRGLLFHYNTSDTPGPATYVRSFFGMDNASEKLVYKTNVASGSLVPLAPDFSSLGTFGAAKFGSLELVSASLGGPGTGALVVTGGGSFTGELYVQGSKVITTGTIGTYAVTNAQAGDDISVSANVGTVVISNTSTLQTVTTRGAQTDRVVNFTNTSNATGTTTGAVTISGGLGVGKDLYAQNIYSNGALVVTEGTIGSLGVTSLYAGTDTVVSSSTGIVYVWNNSTLESVTSRGSSTSHILTITNIEESTSTNTGALRVLGGAAIAGNVNAAQIFVTTATVNGDINSSSTNTGALTVIGGVGIGKSVTIGEALSVLSTVDASSTITGALKVSGGISLAKKLYAGGDLYTEQNITSLGGNLTLTNATGTNISSSLSGLNISAAGNVSVTALTDINLISGTKIVANVNMFSATTYMTVGGTVNALDTSSGALVIAGGVGVGRDLHAQNIYSNGSIVVTNASLGDYGVTSINTGSGISVNTSTGIVTIQSIDTLQDVTNRWSTTTNRITIINDAATNSTVTGALIVQGGGIAADSSYFVTGIVQNTLTINGANGGSLNVTDTTDSIGPASGAVTIAGGLSVGFSIYAGAVYDDGQRVVTKVNPNAGPGITITDEIGVGTSTSFTVNNSGVIAAVGSTYLGVNTATGIVTFTNLGVQTLTAGTDTSVSRSTGTVIVWNTSTLQSITNRGATTNNAISITNTTDANTSTAGALIVSGGVGVAKNLVVGGNAAVYGNLQVYGIQTYVNSTQTVITDPVIGVGAGTNNSNLGINDGLDRGVLMHYNTTATSNNVYDNHAFLGMDNATQTLVYKTNIYPGGVQDFPALFSNTGTFGLAKFGGLALTNNTVATNTSTGALTVDGGVGIGGALYVKDAIYVNGAQVLTAGGGGAGGAYVAALYAGTDTAVSANAGEVTIWNTSTLHSVMSRGNDTIYNMIISNASTATAATGQGALKVAGDAIFSKDVFVVGTTILGTDRPTANDANANLLLPFRGIAGTYRTYVELQGVSANDVTNESGGAFVRFRTSTTAGYGPEIGGVRRASGAGDFIIRTGGNTQQDRVIVRDNGNVELTGQLSAGSLQNTPVGSITSSTARFTTLEANGLVKFTNNTVSDTYTNGAVTITGGVGVGTNIVVGPGATTRNVKNANVFASGSFTTNGDAQAGNYVLRKAIGSTSFTALTTDEAVAGTTNQVTLANNSTYAFKVLVTARATASIDGGAWEFQGVATRDTAAGTTLIRMVNKTKIWASLSGYDVQVVADTANGAIQVQAKGHDSSFVRFVARVETSEVTT